MLAPAPNLSGMAMYCPEIKTTALEGLLFKNATILSSLPNWQCQYVAVPVLIAYN